MVASAPAASCLAVLLTAVGCKPTTPPTPTAAARAPSASAPAHCQVLRDRLCAQFGGGSDACAMAKVQSGKLTPERCAAMLDRYDEAAASARRYAEGRQALVARDQLTPHGPAPALGPADAPVTLVVFCDFDDDDCGRASPAARAATNLYPGRVRIVFRQFPLRAHAGARLVAEASLAAQAQGKFWAFHDLVFGNPQAHERAALERYAEQAGLDLPRFRKALDQRTYAADVEADVELGRKLDVSGVPTVFMNGKPVRVPYGTAELADLLGSP